MTDLPTGVLAYFAISAIVALAMHACVRRFSIACLACFFLGPAAFVAVCLARGESIPPPPLAATLFFATLSLLMAGVIGMPFWLVRRRAHAR